MAAAYFLAGQQLLGGFMEYQAYKNQARAIEKQAEINQIFTDMKIEDAILRGKKESREYAKKIRKVSASQKAALAAQGIAFESETAIDVLADTAEEGSLNIETIVNNSWRQAFGFKQEGATQKFKARMEAASARAKAKSSLLTGVTKSAGSAALAYESYQGNSTKAKVPTLPKGTQTGSSLLTSPSAYSNYA